VELALADLKIRRGSGVMAGARENGR